MQILVVKVILDANFLFVPLQFHIDIFEELQKLLAQRLNFVVLSPTLQELQKLAAKGSPKIRRQTSFALKLIEKCCVINVKQLPDETHDDVVARVAVEWRCPVATNDRTLRRKLRKLGVAVVYLRERSRLEVEGEVESS